jgi:glycosyltransferase involved in cell wall biosynthesis
MPKVSIIVPVYNVEKYLRKCLDSLIYQTLEDIEIIVVNDCSPDNSQSIIDEYALKDKRVISVLHKENLGQGAARNTGLRLAIADYIGFIGGDDWVTLDMYAILHKNIQRYHADISQIQLVSIKQEDIDFHTDKIITQHKKLDTKINIIENKAIIQAHLDGHIPTSPTIKLYQKSLFTENHIVFPGHLYEDLPTTFNLLLHAKKFVDIDLICYYYYYRPGSSTKSYSIQHITDYQKCFDSIAISAQKYDINPLDVTKLMITHIGFCYTDRIIPFIENKYDYLIKLSIFHKTFGKLGKYVSKTMASRNNWIKLYYSFLFLGFFFTMNKVYQYICRKKQ